MRIQFTPQSKAALRINLTLVSTLGILSVLEINSFWIGFPIGVLNFFYVLHEVSQFKS